MRVDYASMGLVVLAAVFATIFYLDYFTTPADGYDTLAAGVLAAFVAGMCWQFVPDVRYLIEQRRREKQERERYERERQERVREREERRQKADDDDGGGG